MKKNNLKQKSLPASPVPVRFRASWRGQTMIETVVAIGIAVIIIGALVTLINASNRRATLARQSTQASKLAQEGMEIVRNIRDVDADDAVRTGRRSGGILCSVAFPCKFTQLYEFSQGDLAAFLYPPDLSCNVGSWCLVGVQPASEQSILGIFSRSVEISDDPLPAPISSICSGIPGGTTSNTKRITVRVGWESPIGHQERTVVSCLTKWR